MPPIAIPIAIGLGTVGAVAAAASVSANAQKKAAESAENLAREQQQQALEEQKRLEEKYDLTPGELGREERLLGVPAGQQPTQFAQEGLEARRQTELERRAGLPGEELLRETGPTTRTLLDRISANLGMTPEELFTSQGGEPARQYLQTLISDEPLAMFKPELDLAIQAVAQKAAGRGIYAKPIAGDLGLETMGRAGVDAAIAAARERLSSQANLANALITLSSAARSEAGTVGERALTSSERSRTELAQFLQDLQQQSAASKQRAMQAGIGSAQITQPSVAQSYQNLIGLEGYKGGIQSPAEAGLSALSQIGTLALTGGLGTQTTKPTGMTLGQARTTTAEYSPITSLRGLTGADIMDEYEAIRKKRLYG